MVIWRTRSKVCSSMVILIELVAIHSLTLCFVCLRHMAASTRLRMVESIVFQLFAMAEPEPSPDFDKVTESVLTTFEALSVPASAALSTASSSSSPPPVSDTSSGGSVPAPALTFHQRNAMRYMADYFQYRTLLFSSSYIVVFFCARIFIHRRGHAISTAYICLFSSLGTHDAQRCTFDVAG